MLLKGRCDVVFEVVKVRKIDQIYSAEEGDPMFRQIELYGGQEERETDFEGKTLQDIQSESEQASYK